MGVIPEDIEAFSHIPKWTNPYTYTNTLPSSVDNVSRFPTPGNQGSQGSCVAWAVGYALMSNGEYMKRSWNINSSKHQFSPAYIYNQFATSQTSGMELSAALTLAKNQGVCPLSYWQYNESDYTTQPTAIQNAAASLYKGQYFEVENIEDMKMLLSFGYGVVILIKTYDDLYNLSSTNQIYDNTSGNCSGQHAICLIGYDDNKSSGAFKFINSWGTDWGVNGYGWILYDLVNSSINPLGAGVGFTFSPPTTDSYIMGDINNDGQITSEDARLALRYSTNAETPTAMQYVLADVDGDAQITSADSREILQYSTGLIDHFSLYD